MRRVVSVSIPRARAERVAGAWPIARVCLQGFEKERFFFGSLSGTVDRRELGTEKQKKGPTRCARNHRNHPGRVRPMKKVYHSIFCGSMGRMGELNQTFEGMSNLFYHRIVRTF